VVDEFGKTSRVNCVDERYLSGELVSISVGKIVVKDIDGNIFHTNTDDPRFVSGELVGATKGTVVVKDVFGNMFRTSITDPRFISGELISIAKGMVTVKDINGVVYKVNTSDPLYESGELVPIWTGKRHSERSKMKIGEANSKHQQGSGNSQYGTCWIYNLDLKKCKKIYKSDLDQWLLNGWIKGRKMKF